MGVFTVILEELQDAYDAVMKQIDVVSDMARNLKDFLVKLIGVKWTGSGAERFLQVMNDLVLAVLDKVMEIVIYFVQGALQTLDYLRELDDMLSSPVDAIGGIFGF